MIRMPSLAMAAGAFACGAAVAQEPPFPTVSTDISADVFYIARESDGDDTQHAFLSAQPSVAVEWWNGVFLNGVLNVTDYQPDGEDSFFEHQDVNIDSVNLFVTNWVASGQFGKTSLPFGLAPSDAPGLFGSDFVGDYGYDGLIAAIGGYDLGHALADGTAGTHTLLAGAFFVDTTFMSATAFGEVDSTRLDDGGPANTEGFDSWVLTYDATGVPLLPGGVDYRASWISNAAGRGDTGDERGWSLGAATTIPIAGRDALSSASGRLIALTPVVEYARIENFGGVAGVDRDYWTAGLEGFMGQWFATATTTLREIDDPVNGDGTDRLYALSGGYQFNEAALVQLGYAFEEVGGVDSHLVGLQFSYDFQPSDYTSYWPRFGKPARVLTNTQLQENYRQ